MLWSRRSFLLLLPVSACGFTPAFGTKGPAEELLGTVRATDPTDKNGFDFVQHIEERLGRPTTPVYDLTYSIATNPIGVGITPDGATTRYNLTGTLTWALTRKADQKRMAGGSFGTFTSYSATGSTVAGLTAQTDASLRLMRLFADDVVARLVAASPGFPA